MTTGRVNNKVAFITGGASGLGEATAKLLSKEGASIVITDIDLTNGDRVASEIGKDTLFLEHDVTSEESWKISIAAAQEKFGQIDVVVNCAGISIPSSIEDLSFDLWRQTQQVNADSVMLGTKYAVEALKEKGGAIVNISSSLAIRVTGDQTAYCASKAAVSSITKTTALHCANSGYNVRINAVNPGAIHTPMVEKYLAEGDREEILSAFASVHPLGRIGKPDDIAYAVLYLASDESSFVTGVELPVDGGFTAA